jgi:hypothetical protein
MMMVLTARSVDMRFRCGRRHEGLTRKDDPAAFLLCGQMLGDFRMVGADIPDETAKKALRLKVGS